MDVEKIEININISNVLSEVEQYIFSDKNFVDQICLQGLTENGDPYYGSRGMLEVDSEYTENDFCVNLFPDMKYTNSLIGDLGIKRTRIMRMKPKTCLSYHYDRTWRVHVPLITNPGCFLLIDKTAHHLEANGAYRVNTTKYHTAINASFEARTHLVGIL